ncbi:unnamed protein product [Calypogeia fissa]
MAMVGTLRSTMRQPRSPLVEASMSQAFFVVLCCIMGLATVSPTVPLAHAQLVAPPPGGATPIGTPIGTPIVTDCAQKIAVPSYVYPCFTATCPWGIFKTGASIVIINPNSGPNFPDNQTKNDYIQLVDTVKTNSTVTTVLGYVSTSYGNRNSSAVLADIDAYNQSFSTKLDGIFLDEGNTSCSSLSTYRLYDLRVKLYWGFTALNWGVIGSECFLNGTSINTYCSFENSYSAYNSTAYADSPSWVYDYPDTKFWHIVHTTPSDETSVQTGVSLSKTRHAGYIYFTDAVGTSNPYNVAPSPIVWQTEVAGAKNATC